MRKSLITGITGFVGSHLAEYLLNNTDEEVYGTYRWRSPRDNIENIESALKLVPFELTDYASVLSCIETVKPDVIYHLAAQSYVKDSYIHPFATLEVNTGGTAKLLEAVKTLKHQGEIDPIIHICSSSEVYGQVKEEETPITEDNPFRPASPYAVSKAGADLFALQYHDSWGLKTIRTRMFTHTGPRRGEVFVVSAFAKQIAMIEKGFQEPVLRHGNLDSIRTFTDVRDAVKAYRLLVNKCKPGEVYNIGGSETMSIRKMLKELLELSPKKKEIELRLSRNLLRPSDVTLQIPDAGKFKKETGWEPEIPFEKTLRDTLNYWRNELKNK
jgi:GDP-mannose 4,6-dehydratase